MNDDEVAARRVQFFGVHDLATWWFVERVAELVERFDPANVPANTADIIELHNVQQYLEHNFLPCAYTDAERVRAASRIPQIRSAVARFFASINDANCAALIANVDYNYHADLLRLLGRNKAFERCGAGVLLPALDRAGVHLGEMLASDKLVEAYSREIRQKLCASPQNAEYLVRKHMMKDVKDEIHIPPCFSPADARQLLEGYVDSLDAHPNYVGLIETAHVIPAIGVDAKLKLRAKRRRDGMTRKLFEENTAFKTGCEVAISETQEEPATYQMDESGETVVRFTYSSLWLEQTLDNPSILNNFQHLFEFADQHVLLTFPSYPARLGVFERLIKTTGKTDYQVGATFQVIDMSTLLQTRLYHHYLETQDRDLEDVISWFFEEYLVEEFGALNFSFTPSARTSSYLQKVRHLFAEMEGITTQFSLFVENGELEKDLLTIASEPVRYKLVPSLLPGKYVYQGAGDEIEGVLHALFSDQSSLNYINEELMADNAAHLLLRNQVAYGEFHDYQKPTIDHLIKLGVLADTGTRVHIANVERFQILKSLFATQAASYYHLSDSGRAEADAMVARGWVIRRASLLTEAEGKYFNYFLNKVDFSNGPELRNKYLHGSQGNVEGGESHFHTYLIALRLTVALVIKMNDEFCLAALRNPLITPAPS